MNTAILTPIWALFFMGFVILLLFLFFLHARSLSKIKDNEIVTLEYEKNLIEAELETSIKHTKIQAEFATKHARRASVIGEERDILKKDIQYWKTQCNRARRNQGLAPLPPREHEQC